MKALISVLLLFLFLSSVTVAQDKPNVAVADTSVPEGGTENRSYVEMFTMSWHGVIKKMNTATNTYPVL